MSRPRIAVVGAGPAGTTLALGLLQHGCTVTLVTDRTAEEIRGGAVMSSQVTFESALEVEAALGVPALLPEAPRIDRMTFDVRYADGARASFETPLSAPARSIDLRVKVPALLEEVERLGGTVVVREAGVDDVEELAESHELVVVSTGRGGLADLFAVDEDRSPYDAPQRSAALTYLRPGSGDAGFGYHVVDGVGECFTCPALTVDGPCDIVVVTGARGGPLDVWDDVTTPAAHLGRLLEVLREHFPDVADRYAGASLVDDGAVLRGGFRPVVRRPVGTLPSGAAVIAMADVVVLNDPLTSQGSNNAIKSASFYLDAIIKHAEQGRPFDAAWMERTFANFWRGWAHFATRWTNDWLRPHEPHQRRAVEAAATLPGVAERVAAGFDDARLFDPWWFDASATEAFLAEQRAVASGPFDARDLRRALGQYATGVTVVTACHGGEAAAMTANSFTSVSLNPPIVLWAAAGSSPSLPVFDAAGTFAVNVLAADQHHLSRQFSTSGRDKFDGVRLVDDGGDGDGEGPPLIEGTVARFVVRRLPGPQGRVEAGDHVVFFGEIESYDAPGGEPLVFHSGFYRLATKHPDL